MNINPIVIVALSGITSEGKAVPVEPLVYTGPETTYITFYTILEKDETYADDDAVQSSTTGTLDIYCKGNYKALLADVVSRLKGVGFTITGIGPEMYERDTGYNHVPIDFYMEDADGGI